MPRSLPRIDFRQIREHLTTQQRGFEELCFQLVPDLESLPAGTDLHRRASPDGGVEFWCKDPTGDGKWAWQAKFLFGLNGDAYAQMSRSVTDAIAANPGLTRYVLLLPVDRTGRRSGNRGQSGEERWASEVAGWESIARAAGATIEFAFRGHSDLLRVLNNGRHNGAVRYWFQTDFLDIEFFRHHVAREIQDLGTRYRPSLHVDLPIAEEVEAVARSDVWLRELDRLRQEVRPYEIETKDLAEPAADILADAKSAVTQALEALVVRWAFLQDPTSSALTDIERLLADALDRLAVAERRLSEARPTEDRESPDNRRRVRAVQQVVWHVRGQLESLHSALGNPVDQARRLLVVGPAGCGKSHVVADVARRRVEAGLPTILLLGQKFANAEIWPQVAAMVGLDLPRDDLLDALSAAAETRAQGPTLIVIDALNEREGVMTWRDRLGGFLEDVRRHSWVAVALTIRDTYEDAIIQHQSIPRVIHPGLAGHEDEAIDRYAHHYNLRLADLPPLLPELSNPLFLYSLCEALSGQGRVELPRADLGVSWVFDGLVSTVERRLAQPDRLDFAIQERPVSRALDARAAVLLDEPNDVVPWARANGICEEVLPRGRRSQSLLAAMAAEGLLLEDVNGTDSVVRFTYQRFADFRMAREFLRRHPTTEDIGEQVSALATGPDLWRWFGLLEALAIVVPQEVGVDLIDVVASARSRGPSGPQGNSLNEMLSRHLISSLEWRGTSSITPRTVELATAATETGVIDADDWLDLLVRLACVSGHPLNMVRTHSRLVSMSLPDRDLAWSWPLTGSYGSNQSLRRTMTWSLSHGSSAQGEVVDLAGMLLAWSLSNPNRRVRDRATKALLCLTDRRPRLLASLISRFGSVNDPYVVERMLAVAAGWALRRRNDPEPSTSDLEEVFLVTYDAVFSAAPPKHLMIRHYGRVAVENLAMVLRDRQVTVLRDVARAAPPYGSDWPHEAPSQDDLVESFGPEGRWTVIDEGDDFYRYTIEGAIRDFVPPGQGGMQASRRRRLRRDLDAAQTALEQRLEHWALQDPSVPARLHAGEVTRADLPDEARKALDDVQNLEWNLSRGAEPIRIEPDLVARTVSNRVLDLGWTHARFGAVDRVLGQGRSRMREPLERFAKKYAWIGLYETLGQVADHCQIQESYRNVRPRPYEGPWDVGYTPDIDPTHVLIGSGRVDSPEAEPSWWKRSYHHRLDPLAGDHRWLSHTGDLPDLGTLLTAQDPRGERWLALEAHGRWEHDHGRPRTGLTEDKRDLWIRTQSYLIKRSDSPRVRRWSETRNWMGLWMPMPGEYSDAYMGAYPDRAPWPAMMRTRDKENRAPSGWRRVERRRLSAPLADTVAWYTFDRERDFSSEDGYSSSALLAPAILEILGARWNPTADDAASLRLGPNERERSWTIGDRTVAFFAGPRDQDAPSALFVRASVLLPALQQKDLAIWSWVLGEKAYWSDGEPSRERMEVFGSGSWDFHGWVEWALTCEYVDHQAHQRHVVLRRPASRATRVRAEPHREVGV